MIKITDKISYIEGYDEPLSCDVGIIIDGDSTWLYDVGNGERMLDSLPGGGNVVISHFHKDHLGNIDKLSYSKLYVSKETYRHTKSGEIVSSEVKIGNVRIFTIPSCHAKGCLGFEVDEEYAFVGDAIYSKVCEYGRLYNAQLLKAQIEVLKSLKADKLLLSHYKGMVRDKTEVICELEKIYSLRNKDGYEILIDR